MKKTVNQIILLSLVCGYFGGIYLLATRFGFIKLLSRYGLSRVWNAIPADFPEMKWLYVALAAYTALYALLTWLVMRQMLAYGKAVTQMQQDVASVRSYTDRMAYSIAQWEKNGRERGLDISSTATLLRRLHDRIRAFPSSAMQHPQVRSALSETVTRLDEAVESLAHGTADEAQTTSAELERWLRHALEQWAFLQKQNLKITE